MFVDEVAREAEKDEVDKVKIDATNRLVNYSFIHCANRPY